MNKKSYVSKLSDDEFKKIISECYYYSDVSRKCGYKCITNYRTIKKRIKLLNLDTSHFKKYKPIENKKNNINDILTKDSSFSTSTVKRRLLNELNWEHKCLFCKRKSCIWMMYNKEAPIPLELDHINGDNKDHRIENLRLLCPTCHSTTKTFKGRNVKHIKVKYTCMDCNKNISKKAKRCRSCACQNREKIKRESKLEI
tara:strand:+ start:233 stop:829 length:597 start_codon:yes stop_codon:yes gene_type:complete